MAPLLPLYLFLLSILCAALADPVHLPLSRRARPNRTIADIIAAANNVRARYGYASPHSRASKRAGVANVQIIDQACFNATASPIIFLYFLTGTRHCLHCQHKYRYSVSTAVLHRHLLLIHTPHQTADFECYSRYRFLRSLGCRYPVQ